MYKDTWGGGKENQPLQEVVLDQKKIPKLFQVYQNQENVQCNLSPSNTSYETVS